MRTELFAALFVINLWLITAWEAILLLSRGKIRRIESRDKKLARKLEGYLAQRDDCIVVFRILTFFFISFMAALICSFLRDYSYGFLFAGFLVALDVLIIVIVSEILAQLLLFKLDIFIIRMTVPLITALRYSLLFPVAFLVKAIKDKINDWESGEGNGEKPTPEDEILSLVEKDSHKNDEEGYLEEDERRMIRGIFDLDDTLVKEIMTPRVDMTALPSDASTEDAKREIVESGHSRIPVYGKNIDEILGVIYAKDFLSPESDGKTLAQIAHKPVFIPETKNVGELLDEFKKNSIHVAVIIDEYGGTAGIVTLEDIIEEIVGDIRDEYDTEEDAEPEPEQMPDGSFIIDARMHINDVNHLIDSDISEDEDADTIGGYICGHLGRIPAPGEQVELEDNITAAILKADRRKIISIRIKKEDHEQREK